MSRILFGAACLLSLVLCAAAVAVVRHSHRTWHNVVWRTDAAAAAEKAHTSLGSIWREYRESGKVPGQVPGRRVKRASRDIYALSVPQAPAPAVQREYASLTVANGRVEYHRYPEPSPPPV